MANLASTESAWQPCQTLLSCCRVCEREIKRDRRQRKAAVEALSLGQAGIAVKRQKQRHTSEELQAEAELEGQQAVEAQVIDHLQAQP